jgi:hypothetical protein
VNRWEDIPFNQKDKPEDKASDFDSQLQENGGPTPEELEEEAKRGPRR